MTCIGTQRTQRIQYGLVPKVNKDGDNDVTKNIIFFYVSKKLHFLCFASGNEWKDHKTTKACIKSR